MKIILKILRKLKFSTIRTKIAAIISILIALISLFMFVYFPTRLEKQAIKAISDKAKSIAEIAAFNVAPALFFEDVSNVDASVKSVKQNKDLTYIIIKNNSGEIFSSFNKGEAEKLNYTEIINDNGISTDGTTLKILTPISLNDQKIG